MKVWNLIVFTLALALAVAGCGGDSKEGASTSQSTGKSAGDKRTIKPIAHCWQPGKHHMRPNQ